MQPSDCVSANEGADGVDRDVTKAAVDRENIDLLRRGSCRQRVFDFVQPIRARGYIADDPTVFRFDPTTLAFECDRKNWPRRCD